MRSLRAVPLIVKWISSGGNGVRKFIASPIFGFVGVSLHELYVKDKRIKEASRNKFG
jgi:hypothetical protein